MQKVPQLQPFMQVLQYSAATAMKRYEDETARIAKAVELVVAGHVTFTPHGYAHVTSQTGHGRYTCKSMCTCPDFFKAPGGRCKHRYAVSLLKHTHTILKVARYTVTTQADGSEIAGIAFPIADYTQIMFLPEGQDWGWTVDPHEVVILAPVTAPLFTETVAA